MRAAPLIAVKALLDKLMRANVPIMSDAATFVYVRGVRVSFAGTFDADDARARPAI